MLLTLGDRVDLSLNRRIHHLARAVDAHPLPGIGAAIPGYATLLVRYDPLLLSYSQVAGWLEQIQVAESEMVAAPRRVEIPVCYGGEAGPDLAFVAAHNHLSQAEVVRLHAAGVYPVYLMGFTPGFPYLGGLDPSIAAPRLESPRPLVPAGSVGIAGEQTGIYPLASPGGWRIIGRTHLSLFDLNRDPPFLLAPGDEIVFVPTSVEEG